MKKKGLLLITFIFPMILILPSVSSAEWVLQLSSGSAYNFPTSLNIRQNNQKDINLSAEYDTKAWSTLAYYYDLRFAKWNKDHAWELETLHHKLFLSNRPATVDKFAISHGYNLNTINSAWRIKGFIYRIGAGVVITHPETIVRGKRFIDKGGINGFHFSGITGQAAIEKRFHLSDKIFLSIESKLTASYAKIPVAEGHAKAPNVAIHGLFGLGYIL